MEMVQSNSEDEGVDCRDSLVSFVSPIAAPMGAEIWAAQHVPGVNIAQAPTYALVAQGPHYFGDQPAQSQEQGGEGDGSSESGSIGSFPY
jgi:hypothetical protein